MTTTTTTKKQQQKCLLLALAGDVGGTNTRLALYANPDGVDDDHHDVGKKEKKEAMFVKKYRNIPHVETHGIYAFHYILNDFFKSFRTSLGDDDDSSSMKQYFEEEEEEEKQDDDSTTAVIIVVACLACAGPIKNNSCEFTNIDKSSVANNAKFIIDGNEIMENKNDYLKYIKSVKVVNDFVGQGYGALDLDICTECIELNPNSSKLINPIGPKVCVGAGTGLGECYLTCSSANPKWGYECYPSEGGHVEYNPRTKLEVELREYLMSKFNLQHRLSIERIVSGKGLANIYEFLSIEKYPDQVDESIHNQFMEANDLQAKVIGENVKNNKLCELAYSIMVSAYGSEVGSAALKFIPSGGLYVVGGITSKMLNDHPHYLVSSSSSGESENSLSLFMEAFHDKGRVSKLLQDIPVFAVIPDDLGLRGARFVAFRELQRFK